MSPLRIEPAVIAAALAADADLVNHVAPAFRGSWVAAWLPAIVGTVGCRSVADVNVNLVHGPAVTDTFSG